MITQVYRVASSILKHMMAQFASLGVLSIAALALSSVVLSMSAGSAMAADTYKLTLLDSSNGGLLVTDSTGRTYASGDTILSGASLYITAQPQNRFQLGAWTGNAEVLCTQGTVTCRIPNVGSNVILGAYFKLDSFFHPGALIDQVALKNIRNALANPSDTVLAAIGASSAKMLAEQTWMPTPAQLDAGASINYTPQPHKFVYRSYTGPGQGDYDTTPGVCPAIGSSCSGYWNVDSYHRDALMALDLALQYKATGRVQYANKAVEILNAWGKNFQRFADDNGNFEILLEAHIHGYLFFSAAELLRDYPGWQRDDFDTFRAMAKRAFLPQLMSVRNGGGYEFGYWPSNAFGWLGVWSSWYTLQSMAAYGILMDDPETFNYAIEYFKKSWTNGQIDRLVYYVHPGNLGQNNESVRDVGHMGLSLNGMATFAQIVWNQGIDLYSYDNYRILAGSEYAAKANLTLPSASPGSCTETTPEKCYEMPIMWYQNYSALGPSGRGRTLTYPATVLSQIYERHFGLRAKYSQMAKQVGGLDGSGFESAPYSDFWATRPYSYEPIALTDNSGFYSSRPPVLSGKSRERGAQLSWFGSHGVDRYSVQRSTNPTSGFQTIATGINDLLTYTDTPSQPGTYYYRVVGTDANAYPITSPSSALKIVTGMASLRNELNWCQSTGNYENDLNGNTFYGTFGSGVTRTTEGNVPVINFDGSANAYVHLPDNLNVGVGNYSVSAWVKPGGGNTWQSLLSIGNSGARYAAIQIHPSTGTAFASSLNGGNDQQTLIGPKLPQGAWTHVVLTFSGSYCSKFNASGSCTQGGNTATLYMNGKEVAQMIGIRNDIDDLGSTTHNYLGLSQYPQDPNFNGRLGNFRIYDGALNTSEVSQLYQSGMNRPCTGSNDTIKATLPASAVKCADEHQTCVLPSGTTASVWYGASNTWMVRNQLSGRIACNNDTFREPAYGVGKSCWYSINDSKNLPPVVVLRQPITKSVSNTEGYIEATATDSDGSIAKVEFYYGNTLLSTVSKAPYVLHWAGVADGTYALTAKVFDDKGSFTNSNAVTIVINVNAVDKNQPPTVSLSQPVAITNNTGYIEATAQDSDGSIAKVEFYYGNTLLTTAYTAPYRANWTNAPAGTYNITAKAYDNVGAVATSKIVQVIMK